MFDQGLDADLGYPGIVLDGSANQVEGLVFSAEGLDLQWPMLAEFEGEGYQRVLTTAILDSGEQLMVYVYALIRC